MEFSYTRVVGPEPPVTVGSSLRLTWIREHSRELQAMKNENIVMIYTRACILVLIGVFCLTQQVRGYGLINIFATALRIRVCEYL